MRGLATRALVAILLCMTAGAGLWTLTAVTGSARHEADANTSPQLPGGDGAVPRVAPLSVTVASTTATAPGAAPAGSGPLADWATRTAALTAVPADILTGDANAELQMRREAPGCHLSWVTVAAIGLIDPARRPDPLGTARTLCANNTDTGTDPGWFTAIRTAGGPAGTAYVHRALAAAITYATVLRSNTPLAPQARTAIDFAIAQIGLPYVWGGNGPAGGDAGFDCSGLTHAAYAAAGVGLPRTAHTQFFATPRIAQPRPGDLVFFGDPRTKIHHVGLYVGDGMMINAPTFGRPVQVGLVSVHDDYAGAGAAVPTGQ